MPCTPDELNQLAEMLANNKLGETTAIPIEFNDGPAASISQIVTRSQAGLLSHWRPMRGAVGDKLSAEAYDRVAMESNRANNFLSKEQKILNDALKPFTKRWTGLPTTEGEAVGKAIEQLDAKGIYKGADGLFSPQVITAAETIYKQLNRLGIEHGVGAHNFITGYRPHVRRKPNGIMWDEVDVPPEVASFRKNLTSEEVKFYHEMERKGTMIDPDPSIYASVMSYLHGIAKAKILKPAIDDIEDTVIGPALGLRYFKDKNGVLDVMSNDPTSHALWKEYKNHMFGGVTPMDVTLTGSLQGLLGMFGKTGDTSTLYKISHGLSSAAYAGALGSPFGGRPASVIRQFFQVVPSLAEFGAKYTLMGMAKTLKPGGIKSLIERNMITSPIESLADNVGVARGVGRAISISTEHTLKLFGAADRMVRAFTANSAEARFNDYLSRGIIDKLPMRKELRPELERLIKQDKMTEALDRYMFDNIATLQYIFGKANRPEAFRGALGNLAGALMSYPMNSFEMARMFAKRAIPEKYGGGGDAKPLARLLLLTAGIGYAGSEYLNADLRSALLLGAMPHSLMFPKIAMDSFQAGSSTVEWATGSIFNIGESDFHKHKRTQHMNDFARDLRLFVPGGLFFFEDIPRALDEGGITRMLALTPKAAEINKQAAARRQEQNPKNALGGLGGLGGL